MRATWIVLVLLAVVPALAYLGLEGLGWTEAVRYISTTIWRPGDPSRFDLICLGMTLFALVWAKLMLPTLLLAAAPFFAGDVVRVIRRRRAAAAAP
jgi:hypothetical protein